MTEHLSEQAKEIRRLMPRQGGSVILNDVSNYLMIGSAPLLVAEVHSHISGKVVSPLTAKLSGAAMLVGAGWGLFEGVSEARRLEEYRKASLQETSNLRHESDSQEIDIQNLKQAVEVQKKDIEHLRTPSTNSAAHTSHIKHDETLSDVTQKPDHHLSSAVHEGKASHKDAPHHSRT